MSLEPSLIRKYKKHRIPCSKCGIIVERTNNCKKATCFDCKALGKRTAAHDNYIKRRTTNRASKS